MVNSGNRLYNLIKYSDIHIHIIEEIGDKVADALKDMYNETFLLEFSQSVSQHFPAFRSALFVEQVLDDKWEALTLKERIRKISTTLGKYIPQDYEQAIDLLLKVNQSCIGFPYLFLPDFVEVYGQEEVNWTLSMQALEAFTVHSSAEFAVRVFIIKYPERMMGQMGVWAESTNEHVRRLASEGCRPRLPWGQALSQFKQDPSPIFPILETLKQDSSLYVRKSVANNINDIAKDHPERIIKLAKSWMGMHSNTDWIVRHGCRNLIRQANPDIMGLFGYADSIEEKQLITDAVIESDRRNIHIGEECTLSYTLRIKQGEAVRIRVEYGIGFIKATGKVSIKKFLLSDKVSVGGTILHASRLHRWSDLSTRRHYAGLHRIVLYVNGVEVACTEIDLLI